MNGQVNKQEQGIQEVAPSLDEGTTSDKNLDIQTA